MTKNYIIRLCLTAICCLTGNAMMAQGGWTSSHRKVQGKGDTMPLTVLMPATGLDTGATVKAATTGTTYIGYAKPNDIIYEYDGLALNRNGRVGAAIKLPRERIADFIGLSLSAVRVGWGEKNFTGKADVFVRSSLNGEDLATGSATVKFGWNEVKLKEAIPIPDVDTLVIGYYTNVRANSFCVPHVYPQNQPHSCYLWDDQAVGSDGKEEWFDGTKAGYLTMTILGVVKDEQGNLNNKLTINTHRFDYITLKDRINTGMFKLTNAGTNPINSVEVTCTRGDDKWNYTVNFSNPLAAGITSYVALPYRISGTGMTTFSLSKVNDEKKDNPISLTQEFIAIPQEVADAYPMRSLMEFYTSENSFYPITYFEDYTRSYLEANEDMISYVCQHMDDQFMQGDDEALKMYLDFVNGDKMSVFVPSVCYNRTDYARVYQISNANCPIWGSVPFPEFGMSILEMIREEAHTFASVNADASWNDDNSKLTVNVSGDIAPGILPEGEKLNLTVYLVEYDVETDSQKFSDEKQEEEYGGIYHHPNVIRLNLTPMYGEELENADGAFTKSYDVDIDEYWAANKLGIIAFLNRSTEGHTVKNRQIINTVEHKVAVPTGIGEVVAGEAEGAVTAIYNTAGMKLNRISGKGVYLVKSEKNGKVTVKKILVK